MSRNLPSLIEVSQVEYGGIHLWFKEPLRFSPQTSGGFIVVQEPRFSLRAFSETLDGLLNEVAEILVITWRSYGKAKDEILGPKALELKQNILSAVGRSVERATLCGPCDDVATDFCLDVLSLGAKSGSVMTSLPDDVPVLHDFLKRMPCGKL